MPATDVSRVAKRLAAAWTPDAWTAVCVHIVRADENVPDHYLAAAWAPLRDAARRWPEAVVIGSPTSERALAELLRHVPRGARLFLAGAADVDAALAAEILLAADRNLEPYQRSALASFARAERDRTRRAIAERYTDRDAGFERFLARVRPPG